MPRFSIARLMVWVVIASLGFAALRYPWEVWAGGMLLLTCGVLALGVVGAVCREKAERAWWLGFALFGWGYLALATFGPYRNPKLPTLQLLEVLRSRIGAPPVRYISTGFGMFSGGWMEDHSYVLVGQYLWSLLAASLGGTLARALFAARAGRPSGSPIDRPQVARQLRGHGRSAAIVGLGGLVVVPLLILVGSIIGVPHWDGVIFLVTWALLGLAVIGAVFDHGRSRVVWFGTALFGIGYMILVFGWYSDPEFSRPRLATQQLLIVLRPWLPRVVRQAPPSSEAVAVANARVRKALELPVSLHFPNETPLEDVLKAIRDGTRGADGPGIPIYLDPVGLQEAEKTPSSTVEIDVEGVPLKTSLRLLLRQLGLTYSIRGGLLHVIADQGNDSRLEEDPYLSAGHCLLALLAAGLGGLAGELILGRREEPTSAEGIVLWLCPSNSVFKTFFVQLTCLHINYDSVLIIIPT